MSWPPVIRQPGEGEKILFKIGLMTFKVSSAMTDGQFMFCETELPPGASVEPHQHPEAEVFYILHGAFTFRVGDMDNPVSCNAGAFISVPPHVLHAFENAGPSAGRILGMMMPSGPDGLESLFRRFGVAVEREDEIPDVNAPIEQWQAMIARRKPSD
jgi:quercetin dioxygenase-like cupin family protein